MIPGQLQNDEDQRINLQICVKGNPPFCMQMPKNVKQLGLIIYQQIEPYRDCSVKLEVVNDFYVNLSKYKTPGDIETIIQHVLKLPNIDTLNISVTAKRNNETGQWPEDELQLGTSASPICDEESEKDVDDVVLEKKNQKAEVYPSLPDTLEFDCIPNKHTNDDLITMMYAKMKNHEGITFAEEGSYNDAEPIKPTYVGLVNQAMTCYLNSLLQALYMTPEFRNALYNWEYKNGDKTKNIPFQLQRLFLNLQTSTKSAVETTSLTKSFGWGPADTWHQHDIQELCRVMFDRLEKQFTDTAQADLINRLYEGKINDYVKCLTCNTEKSREDTFLDIPLPVKPFGANVAYGSVEEALEAFVKYETLEGNNQYFCEKCNKKSDAHKGLKFMKFPYILMLQLKRFDFDQNSYHRIKLNDKVTFPDKLNLNAFVESSSNQESSNREEDVDVGIKYDDNGTTDSIVDDDSEQYEPISNRNHIINHDQDDDEGIGISDDMSNGMSSSSCSLQNEHSEKLRREYAKAKGPYIYELFSIMIHSGSASGGHYYAYIKDFRTDKWLSFNDQHVTPITRDDIQKSYGGGMKGCYQGVYRSSTNAYMLMYRQIDPKRNTLPMKVDDFPPHIKDLMDKMKNEEEHALTEYPFKKRIYYRQPDNNVSTVSLNLRMSNTLAQVAESAFELLRYDSGDDLSHYRIVTYNPKYDLVMRTFENQENLPLQHFYHAYHQIDDLLLDKRERGENFEAYPFEPIVTKVYLVNPAELQLVGHVQYVRAYNKQTIKEYKQKLAKYFDVDPNMLKLLGQDLQPNQLLDEYQFESSRSPIRITAMEVRESDSTNNLLQSFCKMAEFFFSGSVTFTIEAEIVEDEKLRELNIPLLNEVDEDEKTPDNVSNHYSCPTVELAKFSINSTVSVMEKDDWNIHETSNSEDSSLSDSDRTLMGDGPEITCFDDDLDLKHLIFIDKWKLTPDKSKQIFKVTMDRSTTEDELKEKLKTHLQIPKEYFKITDMNELSSSVPNSEIKFKEDGEYSILLGRDEKIVDIYSVNMDSQEPLEKQFSIALKKGVRNCQVIAEITAQLKQKMNVDTHLQYVRFIINEDKAYHSIIEDDDDIFAFPVNGIYIQETQTPSFNKGHQNVYVRKWNQIKMQLEEPCTVPINGDDLTKELKQFVPLISNIPSEHLEFSILHAVNSFSTDILDNYRWKTDLQFTDIGSKTFILYRDSRQFPRRTTKRIDPQTMRLMRKERALKINVDST